jgi:hypothetical protein
VTLQNNLRGASWSVAPLDNYNISKHITDVMTLFCIHLRGASWSVAPLDNHNISKHITDVMTLFRIHYFSLVVRLAETRKYYMHIKTISLKVCVFLCFCYSVYRSLFSQLIPK